MRPEDEAKKNSEVEEYTKLFKDKDKLERFLSSYKILEDQAIARFNHYNVLLLWSKELEGQDFEKACEAIEEGREGSRREIINLDKQRRRAEEHLNLLEPIIEKYKKILEAKVQSKDKLYATDQVAKLLNVHVETIRQAVRTGKIEAVKIGRSWKIKKSVLTELIKHGLPNRDK